MRRLLILLLLSLLLMGCSKEVDKKILTFTGESANWKAEYMQYSVEEWNKDKEDAITYDNSAQSRLSLKYTGGSPQKVGTVTYKYEANASSGSGTIEADESGNVNTGIYGGKGVALIRRDAIITLTIQWDGKTEILKLTVR